MSTLFIPLDKRRKTHYNDIMNFSKEIKEGTKVSHTAAENTGFVSNFLSGVISKENYRKLVANFYFVYQALEKEIDKNKEHPAIAPIAFDQLKRVDSLAKDCEYFYGSDWKKTVSPSAAAKQYIARIEEVEPELLVGHHYTRYLGDLSGGMILKNIAQKALNLYDGGLDFYKFEEIPHPKIFKDKYRKALDSLPLKSSEKNNVIVEANYAFRLNMYMFNELSEGDPYPAMTVLWSFAKMTFGFVKSKFAK
tara:strand:+ start:7844 stop:8593 length:750 start_codon:yes stop_codon:yes gene_type:complete